MDVLCHFFPTFCLFVAEEPSRFSQDTEISFLDRLLIFSADLNIYVVRISVYLAGVKLVIGFLIRYKRCSSSKDSLQCSNLAQVLIESVLMENKKSRRFNDTVTHNENGVVCRCLVGAMKSS